MITWDNELAKIASSEIDKQAEIKADDYTLTIEYKPWYGRQMLRVVYTDEPNLKKILSELKKLKFTKTKVDTSGTHTTVTIIDSKPAAIGKDAWDADMKAKKQLFNKLMDMLKKYSNPSNSSSYKYAYGSYADSKSSSIEKASAKVLPEHKKEFQRYVKEIVENLKKYYPDDLNQLVSKKDLGKLSWLITGIISAFNKSNANHNQRKKLFPKKYNEELVTNGDKNMYDSVWFSMNDSQHDTIVKKGLEQAGIKL